MINRPPKYAAVMPAWTSGVWKTKTTRSFCGGIFLAEGDFLCWRVPALGRTFSRSPTPSFLSRGEDKTAESSREKKKLSSGPVKNAPDISHTRYLIFLTTAAAANGNRRRSATGGKENSESDANTAKVSFSPSLSSFLSPRSGPLSRLRWMRRRCVRV